MLEKDNEGNEALKNVMDNMATGNPEDYPKQKVKSWFQIIWIAVMPGLWFLNFHLLDASSFFAHFRSVAIFYVALKGWEYIPEFFDVAEEVGLVKDMSKDDKATEDGE